MMPKARWSRLGLMHAHDLAIADDEVFGSIKDHLARVNRGRSRYKGAALKPDRAVTILANLARWTNPDSLEVDRTAQQIAASTRLHSDIIGRYLSALTEIDVIETVRSARRPNAFTPGRAPVRRMNYLESFFDDLIIDEEWTRGS